MRFRNYIVRYDFISGPFRQLLRHNERPGIDFRATSTSEISPSGNYNGHQAPYRKWKGWKETAVGDIYLWWKRRILLFQKCRREKERGRGATSLLMLNKNTEIHHPGAAGHLSSRGGRKDPMGRYTDTRTRMIINGFTILEMSRVQSSRIYRGVKTKTQLLSPMVGRAVIRRYLTFSARFRIRRLSFPRELSIRSASSYLLLSAFERRT